MNIKLLIFSVLTLGSLGPSQCQKLQAVEHTLLKQGEGALSELKEAGRNEGFLAKLFGTDCFSSAVRKLNADCRRMAEDQRHRLAYDLSRCFLSRSGVQPLPPPCPPATPASQCTAALNDKAFNVYTQFFTNIHSVCLFVANQDFLHQAEQLTLSLHSASTAALVSLSQISANITEQKQVLTALGGGLQSLHTSQQSLSRDMQEGLNRLVKLGEHANLVENALQASMALQQSLADHQSQAIGVLGELAAQEEQRASLAGQRWQATLEAAAAMEARQARYEALQASLVSTSETLQGSLETLGIAQQRSEALLGYLRGSTHTSNDLLAYITAAVVLWVSVGLLAPEQQSVGRAIVALVIGSCFCSERWLLGAIPSLGWSMTPDGKVPVRVVLPGPLALLPLPLPPVLLVNVRWVVRMAWACAALMVAVGRCRSVAARRHRDTREVRAIVRALDKQMQVVAAQQQELLQHVQLLTGVAMLPSIQGMPLLPPAALHTAGPAQDADVGEARKLLANRGRAPKPQGRKSSVDQAAQDVTTPPPAHPVRRQLQPPAATPCPQPSVSGTAPASMLEQQTPGGSQVTEGGADTGAAGAQGRRAAGKRAAGLEQGDDEGSSRRGKSQRTKS